MANRSRSTFRRGITETQRRKKSWIDMNVGPAQGEDVSAGGLTPSALVAPGGEISILQFPSQPGFMESTLLRIRGVLSVPKSTYTSAPDGTEVFAFGIGVVSDVSAAASAVPNPATAIGYDWDGWLFLPAKLHGCSRPDRRNRRREGHAEVEVRRFDRVRGRHRDQQRSWDVLRNLWLLPSGPVPPSVGARMAQLKRVVLPPVAK